MHDIDKDLRRYVTLPIIARPQHVARQFTQQLIVRQVWQNNIELDLMHIKK